MKRELVKIGGQASTAGFRDDRSANELESAPPLPPKPTVLRPNLATIERLMCGIYGGFPEVLAANPGQLLAHRGPDQQGQVDVGLPDGRPFVLGQTRLAVVYRGPVPSPLSRGDSVIAFNGEIYNWLELRAELEARGHRFQTPTDTEVVLCAYTEWGPSCLHRFNGMFALAIWHDGKLFLARDRMGKKPLFYASSPSRFSFASELKAFQNLEFEDVPICQELEFYFDEYTPFRNIKSMRPGEYLIFEPVSGELIRKTWWTFPEHESQIGNEDDALRTFLHLFEDSCRMRRAADVPVTLFLSGGIDSSLIQAVLKLPVTYTVQFREFEATINEQQYVLEFAERHGFDARFVVPTRADFLETFSDLARFIEFPVGSFSVFPLYCLARQARREGFVVALSGEGADELFNGYYRNELLLREDARLEREFSGPYGTLCRRYFGSELERFCRMATRHGFGGVHELFQFFEPRWQAQRSFAQNISVLEATVFLQPLLVMADRLSMGNSLEVRNPFLDHRLVEYSAKLDDRLKYRNGQGKWLLRRALVELVGSDLGITQRRVKHGLPSPVNQWLFKSSTFDRKDWNHVLLGECLKQLALTHEPKSIRRP